jgi:hypothetical protein
MRGIDSSQTSPSSMQQSHIKVEQPLPHQNPKLELTSSPSVTNSGGAKTRELPSWMKRAPSTHDIKEAPAKAAASSPTVDKDKIKKKPKLL